MEIRVIETTINEDNSTRTIFRDFISPENFAILEEEIRKMEELIFIKQLSQYVEDNESDIFNQVALFIEYLRNGITTMFSFRRSDKDEISNITNRLLLNYLGSIKTFIDHTETFLTRKFGDQSDQLIIYKKLLSRYYDQHFVYRFFYHLRNYAQHVRNPIDHFNLSLKVRSEAEMVEGSLDICFDRDSLLNHYGKWKHVEGDLRSKEAVFEVLPLISEMTVLILEITEEIEKIIKEEVLRSGQAILDIVKVSPSIEKEIAVAYNIETDANGKFSGYECVEIPIVYFLT